MTLTEFLLARIAEDEARVEGTGLLGWATFRDSEGHPWTEPVGTNLEAPDAWFGDDEAEDRGATISVAHDERRVLAECEAKRQLIELAQGLVYLREIGDPIAPSTPVGQDILEILAQPYVDHPDFREEWRA